MHQPQGQVLELPKTCRGYKGSICLAFLWFSCYCNLYYLLLSYVWGIVTLAKGQEPVPLQGTGLRGSPSFRTLVVNSLSRFHRALLLAGNTLK